MSSLTVKKKSEFHLEKKIALKLPGRKGVNFDSSQFSKVDIMKILPKMRFSFSSPPLSPSDNYANQGGRERWEIEEESSQSAEFRIPVPCRVPVFPFPTFSTGRAFAFEIKIVNSPIKFERN